MKKDTHSVSVIIPSTGRETLQQCLDAIERQTRHPDELLVIPDTENLGAGHTRNRGIAQAKGDLIAFTDDDCIPPDNWLESLLTIMDQYDADVVGGSLRETDPFLDAIRRRRSFPTVIQEDKGGIVGNTANIIYKRSILEECLRNDGYIFNSQTSGQDIHLLWRLRQRGAKIIYTPKTVFHLRKSTYISYLKHQFKKGTGIAGLYKSYHQAEKHFTAQPSLIWGRGKNGRKANWFKALWLKVIGPFDVGSFRSVGDFMEFWLGEKMQGMGFLWGLFGSNR
jgi:glycosyltransferase involved in cell wall biosynthesis